VVVSSELTCPKCSQQLTFIKPLAVASSTSRDEPVSIYRCSEHGLWRVEADGRIKPFRP
jgi:hypothetical protein